MSKLKRMTTYILILLFTVFTLVQAIPVIRADTQSGFILASAGEDGQIGTNDDIAATESQKAAANKPVNISVTEAVPSAGIVTKEVSTEPKPLRQPNSDEIVIRTPEELAKIGVDPNYPLNSKYILMANLDLSGYSNWVPIGNSSNPFTGQFDGNGFIIKNLTINRPSSNYQGLFGYTSSTAKIINAALENVNITGRSFTGSLVGWNYGTITNNYSTGKVSGSNNYTGGLVGINYGNITNSYSTGSISSSYNDTGGLVGANTGTITNSYSTGSVKGSSYTGGLVGANTGTITNSYSTGSVSGSYNDIGGLVGYNNYGTITNSYSTGSVSGGGGTGGLVGHNYYGTIKNSYSTCSVKGSYYTGGLVGQNFGTITNSYSTGSVSGYTYVGGLIGYNAGSVINSYWDIQASGLTTSASGTGRTTAQMKTQATFTGWDFTNVWAIDEGKSYPYLRTNEQVPHPGTN